MTKQKVLKKTIIFSYDEKNRSSSTEVIVKDKEVIFREENGRTTAFSRNDLVDAVTIKQTNQKGSI